LALASFRASEKPDRELLFYNSLPEIRQRIPNEGST